MTMIPAYKNAPSYKFVTFKFKQINKAVYCQKKKIIVHPKIIYKHIWN